MARGVEVGTLGIYLHPGVRLRGKVDGIAGPVTEAAIKLKLDTIRGT
jgi:hypothetical protein